MLTKKQLKLITSLHKKKYRKEHNLFIAEGEKIVLDLIKNKVKAQTIICTSQWLQDNDNLSKNIEIIECDNTTIKKISSLSTPTKVIGIFHIPHTPIDKKDIENDISLVLDDIQDPGNLGTIIRTADWFGIKNIFCSIGTVDVFNPKVIQATMGAIANVNIIYCDLLEIINEYHSENFPIYGTFLEGKNIYSSKLSNKGFIIMGNEGKGISPAIADIITHKINIPAFSESNTASESLNVATATAIICSEFRKNSML